MPNNSLNNEYWHLECAVQYRRKRDDSYEYVKCNGCGKFCNIYPDDVCQKCNNTGQMKVRLPYPDRPEIPRDLLNHLEKAYKEWVENNT